VDATPEIGWRGSYANFLSEINECNWTLAHRTG